MSHVKAVVEFDYQAEASDELTLKVGDVLSNIINVEEGWCKGTLNGVTGMFPDNFVKIIEDKTAGTKSKKKDILRKMKVTFSYEPANDDELRLNVGDIVDVIADEEEGWARGILHGVEAVFPTNFAEDMKVDQPLPAEPDFINQKPDTYMSGGKKMKGGIGFGNIFGDGPIKLRQASFGSETEQAQDNSNHKNEKSAAAANGGKSTDSRKQQTPKQEIKTIATSPTEARKKNKGAPSPAAAAISTVAAPAVMRCRARVMFDYQAENSDELTLVKGEIVSVINQHLPDAGWWEGEIIDQDGRKRRGVFPDNFVAALPSADDDSEVESTKTKDVKSIDTKLSKIKTTAPDHQSRDDRHSRLSHNPVADSRGAEHEKSAYNKSKHQTSPSPAAKSMHLTNSKRLAPVAPAPPLSTAKPSLETTTGDENSSRDDSYSESTATTATTTAISEPASIKKLTHYKRPAGPKNRKRPDPSGRRERAKESAETDDAAPDGEAPNLEPAENTSSTPSPITTPVDPPQPTVPPIGAKRESAKRAGIQVMPAAASGGADSGEPPPWLKNLKSRTSLKKPQQQPVTAPTSVAADNKDEDAGPTWLAQLKKKTQTSSKSAPVKPPMPVVSKNIGVGVKPPVSNSTHSTDEKPFGINSAVKNAADTVADNTQQVSDEENHSADSPDQGEPVKAPTKPSEVKKSQQVPKLAAAVPPQNPKQPEVSAASRKSISNPKPKPPPPKLKPTLPSSKPQPTGAAGGGLEEIRDDIRALRDTIHTIQHENRQELERLNLELQEERKQRLILQGEVDKLRRRCK